MIRQLIGKKVYNLTGAQDDYMDDKCPAVDSDGTILTVYDRDDAPDEVVLINWQFSDGVFSYDEVTGERGFMAILE